MQIFVYVVKETTSDYCGMCECDVKCFETMEKACKYVGNLLHYPDSIEIDKYELEYEQK